MEALSWLLSSANCDGFIYGFKVGRRSGERREVSLFLFANDTLIFCEASSDQLRYLSWIFMWLEALSGLKVNMDKIEIILVPGFGGCCFDDEV